MALAVQNNVQLRRRSLYTGKLVDGSRSDTVRIGAQFATLDSPEHLPGGLVHTLRTASSPTAHASLHSFRGKQDRLPLRCHLLNTGSTRLGSSFLNRYFVGRLRQGQNIQRFPFAQQSSRRSSQDSLLDRIPHNTQAGSLGMCQNNYSIRHMYLYPLAQVDRNMFPLRSGRRCISKLGLFAITKQLLCSAQLTTAFVHRCFDHTVQCSQNNSQRFTGSILDET